MRALSRWLLGLMLLAVAGRAETRIVGSDLLGSDLVPAVQAFARHNDLDLTIALDGSHTGWQTLQTGTADIALLVIPPGGEAPDDPFFATPVAYHTVAVLVPAELPLGQVSFAQLAGIFGQGEGTAWRRWSDLGVPGPNAARSIAPRMLVRHRNLVRELFCHAVLQGRPLRNGLGVDESVSQMTECLLAGEGGIALAAHPLPDEPKLKTLAVSREAGGVAFLPTARNVHRGDYPLRWPVYLVFRRTETKRLYPLLRFLLGDEVAAVFRQAGLMPVPADARAEAAFGLEQL